MLSAQGAQKAHEDAQLRRRLLFHRILAPDYLMRKTRALVDSSRVASGEVSIATVVDVGRVLFEHEFSETEGMSPEFNRVGGPDSNTCRSCHWRGGPGGAGGVSDNSFVLGTSKDILSADARNPMALDGLGLIQILAQEMTADLHQIRDELTLEASEAGESKSAELISKGVNFGRLVVDQNGVAETTHIEGIDPDLIVKPFRWKGTTYRLRDFVNDSFEEHMDIKEDELSDGQRTALVMFLATQNIPIMAVPKSVQDIEQSFDGLPPKIASIYSDEWSRGKETFERVGCSSCHLPRMILKSALFTTFSSEADLHIEVDLAEQLDLKFDAELGGYPIWLFSDLKRHDLGENNRAQHFDSGVPPEVFLTRRLWGLASTSPYMHDGRAPWLDHAILAHGGEAEQIRDAYLALSSSEQGDLRVFLAALRRRPRPIVR